MKKITSFGLLFSSILIISCRAPEHQPINQGLPTFPVVEVPTKTVVGYSSYPASIEGTTNSAIRAKVSGYITEVLVDEGQKIKKGQSLFQLETESLSQEAAAARANVQAAEVELEKLKPLVQKKIISSVQLETAKARLAQARAAYNSVKANIAYASIKSPVDGFVGAIPYREGSLVSPNDPIPLTTVSDIENIYAFFAMNERDYLNFILNAEGENLSEKIKNFPPVELQLVNDEIYEEKGEIETVTGQVNPSTGTVSFRAIFPNPNGILTNGNSGNIRIQKTYTNAVVVPETATYEEQGITYVYQLQSDSMAVSTIIEVRDRVENLAVVSSGIKAGDLIIAQGVLKLRNNTPITPQPIAFDSLANSLNIVFK